MTIENPHDHVPLMFQAQANGRCQIQRLQRYSDPQAVQWTDEWVDKAYPELPTLPENVQTREYTINWRLITNAGMDDIAIRPVIGARGWPFYPGSSMKGIFRRACNEAQARKYCGSVGSRSDFKPGSLRFHGGYPIDDTWTENLVDIVHPQQAWQVETPNTRDKKGGAFAQISLYQPTMQFGISSDAADVDWDEVWGIWEQAIATGLGGRVCAGYGQVKGAKRDAAKLLYTTFLKGQGQAPKRLDGKGEFRPNIFRAAVRGHALRIFAGLTDERTAQRLVETLFGGVRGKGTVGLVILQFQTSKLSMDMFGSGSYAQPTYEVEGQLSWLLAKKVDGDLATLKRLIGKLTQFAMVLGGFGKSWRRADHRLFFDEYYEDGYKGLIGCHWQWTDPRYWIQDVQVHRIRDFHVLIDRTQQAAIAWMATQGVKPQTVQRPFLREAWHPQNVQVWGRMAADREESEAIHWFHGPYQQAMRKLGVPEGSIYKSSLTGQVSQVGRVWHRMYPWIKVVADPSDPKKPKPVKTAQFIELLTIFPDESAESERFLEFLADGPFEFERLWGGA
ncbi:RAMP superfamily protein [filamentous cyanobacterium LEGE 11480]|uniref:RAMP superfamily protein n=1 Tax=Romeriopsis navalis LEGE 11480 TaxID=2777977 RepID=A0A928Z538_9CYAN|nr:RAMP superfamily protein [Romeriopsis navalis]MBE9030845.1 RAMP superfamily protein [Romeriopsis navalis LEGE 11480]